MILDLETTTTGFLSLKLNGNVASAIVVYQITGFTNKTIQDGGITVEFWYIKVRTSN